MVYAFRKAKKDFLFCWNFGIYLMMVYILLDGAAFTLPTKNF